ncbi:MAG: peptidoglycan DD-metalloendopeptidase family protein [Candidatus Promineifilaceae bacterium]|nr:peptidoglycan DD-metalloendopeptidase family protein [Candidatus Promineifilaceae bacterium]
MSLKRLPTRGEENAAVGAPYRPLLYLSLLLFALLGVGCQAAAPVVGADAGPAIDGGKSEATAVVVAATAVADASPPGEPVDFPAFDLLPTPEPTATPLPTATLANPSLTPTLEPAEEEPGATATPGPTFTPPARPAASANDHYRFYRPVAPPAATWTDKHYPYASTRGGQLRPHHGVEFNVTYDTEILAVAPGTVVVAGSDAETAYGPHTDFYGNLVVVQHDLAHQGQPVFTLYGHLNEVRATTGQQVQAGDVIGLSGATGVADGPHMHFEVRVGQNSYAHTRNPLLWLYPFYGRGTLAGRVVWPDGSLAQGVPVTLHRLDGSAPYSGATTYESDTVNPDPGWNENFVVDDVFAGFYRVTVGTGADAVRVETWVHPGQTSFVEVTLE